MHYLIGFITAVMVLFPAADSGGKSLYQRWMESYEKYLYQQMEENFEREKRDRNAEICQNPSESEVSNEQTADKETKLRSGDVTGGVGEVGQGNRETEPTAEVAIAPQVESQTESSTENRGMDENVAPAEVVREVTPLYSVNGAVLDIGVQEYLYQRLCERGISWFMPYAILMAYQESRFNIYALNQKNLMDSGLFQMRSIYWPEFCAEAGVPCGDIFDPYLQIDVLTFFMARRASWGKTVSEMISAHSQSDYGGYSQEYVDQVMAHQSGLVRIR